jgi:hypothetical protein
MDVMNGLTVVVKDLPDDLSAISARVINRFIAEDAIKFGGDNDVLVEKMMRYCDLYFTRFLAVCDKYNGDPEAIRKWQLELNNDFNDHAIKYEREYCKVAHLANAPFFMTNWSICYLVDVALIVCNVSDKGYEGLGDDAVTELLYIVNFGASLLEELKSDN